MKFAISLLVVVLLSFAQPAPALDFQQLIGRIEQPAQLSGYFYQTKYLNLLDATIDSSGKFSYRRGEEIRWITKQPLESETLMTPDGVSTTQNGRELLRLNGTEQPVSRIMSEVFFAVLTVNWKTLKVYFAPKESASGDQWQLVLTPRNNDIAIVLTQVVLGGERLLHRIVIEEVNGDRTEITLSGFEY